MPGRALSRRSRAGGTIRWSMAAREDSRRGRRRPPRRSHENTSLTTPERLSGAGVRDRAHAPDDRVRAKRNVGPTIAFIRGTDRRAGPMPSRFSQSCGLELSGVLSRLSPIRGRADRSARWTCSVAFWRIRAVSTGRAARRLAARPQRECAARKWACSHPGGGHAMVWLPVPPSTGCPYTGPLARWQAGRRRCSHLVGSCSARRFGAVTQETPKGHRCTPGRPVTCHE